MADHGDRGTSCHLIRLYHVTIDKSTTQRDLQVTRKLAMVITARPQHINMLGTSPKASVAAQPGDAWMERRDIKFVKIVSAFGKSQVIKPLNCLSSLLC